MRESISKKRISETMIATWLGHSCFRLMAQNGTTLILDPFHEEEVGYSLPHLHSDIVVVSHEHEDHNNVSGISGNPSVIRGPGRHMALGIEFLGVATCHDDAGGSLRGENTVFCFSLDGIRVCHLGDNGEPLNPAQVRAIGPVDLLFLPVGGRYTIDALGANEVMRQLHPAMAVPMHYRTPNLSFELEGVDDFLKGRSVRGPLPHLKLERDDMHGKEQVVLLSCIAAGVADGSID